MTWPNSYPSLPGNTPAAHRGKDGPVSALCWTTAAQQEGRLSPYSMGIRCAPVLGRWTCYLNVNRADDAALTASNGPRRGLNSGALWRLEYEPNLKRKGKP